jgi:hypothetical protein
MISQKKGKIVFFCLLAAAFLLLMQITALKSFLLVFYIAAGVSLLVALYHQTNDA